MKTQKNPYEQYPNRPIIIKLNKNFMEWIKMTDLAPLVFADLTESIAENSLLFKSLKAEEKKINAGVWFFYPADKKFVRFPPPFWHRLALVAKNSFLLRDPEMKMNWEEIREIFEKSVIAVAGCSVGSNIIHAIVQDLRPLHIKIADLKEFHITNANRVKISYKDLGKNKAVAAAEQIHAIDPFIKISIYPAGLCSQNLDYFINGSAAIEEPQASIVIDEIDDLKMKLEIRRQARKTRIPVIMATDIGSAVLLDIRRYDINQKLPYAPEVSDEQLEELADKKDFFGFFKAIVGEKNIPPEFKNIMESIPLFQGAAQLGSTAATAAGITAEAVARILLGWKMPERMFFNKQTGEVRKEGEML